MYIELFLLAFNINGAMTAQQAATVLNWNPKHLDIKTRSVEKTLEPLVLQVTTLVSSSATGMWEKLFSKHLNKGHSSVCFFNYCYLPIFPVHLWVSSLFQPQVGLTQ